MATHAAANGQPGQQGHWLNVPGATVQKGAALAAAEAALDGAGWMRCKCLKDAAPH